MNALGLTTRPRLKPVRLLWDSSTHVSPLVVVVISCLLQPGFASGSVDIGHVQFDSAV